MIELKMMTGKAALRLAKEESGLTQGEIADRLGVSHAVTKRYFNINDAYMPSLEMIPRLHPRWLGGISRWGIPFSKQAASCGPRLPPAVVRLTINSRTGRIASVFPRRAWRLAPRSGSGSVIVCDCFIPTVR